MADLKPLGSEKLNGDEKLKRILELTYYNQQNKKSSSTKPELVKESTSGGVYGIVKEKDVYYVKRGLNEQSLDYIGGMFMKNKNRFSSYAEALKRLELLRGQEELQEATKYVLKQNTPQQEAPVSEPSIDSVPPPPAAPEAPMDLPPADASVGDVPSSEEPSADMPTDGGASKRSDYMAEVQKYAGKLGQELRDQQEKMESDDIKYVLNMIISAVDLDKLDLEDLEEIGKKFERDEEEDSIPEPPQDEEVPSDEEVPAPEPESEISEYSGLDELEKFIDTPVFEDDEVMGDEIDLSNYAVTNSDEESETLKEIDLDEIKKEINRSVEATLGKYFN